MNSMQNLKKAPKPEVPPSLQEVGVSVTILPSLKSISRFSAYSSPEVPISGHSRTLDIPLRVSSICNSSCAAMDGALWKVLRCLQSSPAWSALQDLAREITSQVR